MARRLRFEQGTSQYKYRAFPLHQSARWHHVIRLKPTNVSERRAGSIFSVQNESDMLLWNFALRIVKSCFPISPLFSQPGHNNLAQKKNMRYFLSGFFRLWQSPRIGSCARSLFRHSQFPAISLPVACPLHSTLLHSNSQLAGWQSERMDGLATAVAVAVLAWLWEVV